MEGRLLKLRRRQPTAPAFGAARGPRFVHARRRARGRTLATARATGSRTVRALRRRRDAVDAARDAENNAIADGHVCATTMRRWRRRARRRRDLAPRALADRRAQRLDEVARGGPGPRPAPGPRTARSIKLRKKCGDGQLFAKWIVQTQKCREGSRLSAALHKIARRKMRLALRCWRNRLEVLRRNARRARQCVPEVAEPRRPRAGLEPLAAFYRDGQSHEAALATQARARVRTVGASQPDLRAAALRKNECAKRVVEVLFRYRGRQELRCAFFTWRRALPAAEGAAAAAPRQARAPGARRPVLLRLRDERRLLVHVLKKSHTERRLDMLRRKVDGMLADGHANLPKPRRSERASPRVHLAGSGRFHAFLDVANDPQRSGTRARERGAAATETLRKSVDAARRRVPGADARLLDGPPDRGAHEVEGANWPTGGGRMAVLVVS